MPKKKSSSKKQIMAPRDGNPDAEEAKETKETKKSEAKGVSDSG